MVIWYIFPVLVCFTNTNLATLLQSIVKTSFKRGLSEGHDRNDETNDQGDQIGRIVAFWAIVF
jgi:hypothetical protein